MTRMENWEPANQESDVLASYEPLLVHIPGPSQSSVTLPDICPWIPYGQDVPEYLRNLYMRRSACNDVIKRNVRHFHAKV
jgi:hypothetical protein